MVSLEHNDCERHAAYVTNKCCGPPSLGHHPKEHTSRTCPLRTHFCVGSVWLDGILAGASGPSACQAAMSQTRTVRSSEQEANVERSFDSRRRLTSSSWPEKTRTGACSPKRQTLICWSTEHDMNVLLSSHSVSSTEPRKKV